MNEKIVQIKESEVIQSIVDNKTVYLVNLDRVTIVDLSKKTIAQIREDFGNSRYVYFIMEGENE